jgi:hypothetical protein
MLNPHRAIISRDRAMTEQQKDARASILLQKRDPLCAGFGSEMYLTPCIRNHTIGTQTRGIGSTMPQIICGSAPTGMKATWAHASNPSWLAMGSAAKGSTMSTDTRPRRVDSTPTSNLAAVWAARDVPLGSERMAAPKCRHAALEGIRTASPHSARGSACARCSSTDSYCVPAVVSRCVRSICARCMPAQRALCVAVCLQRLPTGPVVVSLDVLRSQQRHLPEVPRAMRENGNL